MHKQKVIEQLQSMGFPSTRYKLVSFDIVTEFGPVGAFDSIKCYELVDKQAQPRLDEIDRDWRPVAVINEKIYVGPSLDLLTLLFNEAHYFDKPNEFDRDLIFQLHNFALDFYQGYQVREEHAINKNKELIIKGTAYAGFGDHIESFPFTTRLQQGQQSEFVVEIANCFDDEL